MGDRYQYSYYFNVRDEDFDEEDVWGVVKERKESNPMVKKPKDPCSPVASIAKMIPRANKSTINEVYKVQQQSAPVNIPDWSRVGRKSSTTSTWADADDVNLKVHHDDDEWIPPHEWIARKLARSQISSFSVCEGAGRTLKGRDLSMVRNAVLSRTGFLE